MAKIKYTLKEINEIATNRIIGAFFNSKEYPAGLSFKISRVAKKFLEVTDDITDKRKELWEKYGEKDENGKIKTENNTLVFKKMDNNEDPLKSFNEEWEEFLEVEVEIDIQKIRISDLKKKNLKGEKEEIEVNPLVFNLMEDIFEPGE